VITEITAPTPAEGSTSNMIPFLRSLSKNGEVNACNLQKALRLYQFITGKMLSYQTITNSAFQIL
jgi:hypothetical protein